MVHTSKNPILSRKASSRKALLGSLSNALLQKKRITTTLAKAKALARFFAPIVTRARKRSKENLHHAYQQAFAILRDKKSLQTLFGEVLPVIKERPGGYTRILKLGRRKGDSAFTALIELVDFNPLLQKGKKVKTRRGRKKQPAVKVADIARVEDKPAQPLVEDATLPATPQLAKEQVPLSEDIAEEIPKSK